MKLKSATFINSSSHRFFTTNINDSVADLEYDGTDLHIRVKSTKEYILMKGSNIKEMRPLEPMQEATPEPTQAKKAK